MDEGRERKREAGPRKLMAESGSDTQTEEGEEEEECCSS